MKRPDLKLLRSEAEEIAAKVDEEVFGSANSDFAEMRRLIDLLKKWLGQLQDDESAILDEEGQVDGGKLRNSLKLIAELRGAVEAYNRMKAGERAHKLMLQAQTMRFAQQLAEPVVAELSALRATLQRGSRDEAAAAIDALLSKRLGEIMKTAAESSLKLSFETYRIN